MDIEMLAFFAILVGAATKTFYDYLFKIVEDPKITFDSLYLVSMLISVLLTIMTTPLLFLNVTVPTGSDFFIFIAMFSYGFTANHLINRPVTLATKKIALIKEATNSVKKPSS